MLLGRGTFRCLSYHCLVLRNDLSGKFRWHPSFHDPRAGCNLKPFVLREACLFTHTRSRDAMLVGIQQGWIYVISLYCPAKMTFSEIYTVSFFPRRQCRRRLNRHRAPGSLPVHAHIYSRVYQLHPKSLVPALSERQRHRECDGLGKHGRNFPIILSMMINMRQVCILSRCGKVSYEDSDKSTFLDILLHLSFSNC